MVGGDRDAEFARLGGQSPAVSRIVEQDVVGDERHALRRKASADRLTGFAEADEGDAPVHRPRILN
ncbi:MAG: hypothetical protein RML56_01950 [Burkholderiales bacterium]|nr:hypothetical protein [Burkholderiales bacterium]